MAKDFLFSYCDWVLVRDFQISIANQLIFGYIFANMFDFSLSDEEIEGASYVGAFDVIVSYDLSFSPSGANYKPVLKQTKTRRLERSKLFAPTITSNDVGLLPAHIYEKTDFIIDIPIAWAMFRFWHQIIAGIVKKFLSEIGKEIVIE